MFPHFEISYFKIRRSYLVLDVNFDNARENYVMQVPYCKRDIFSNIYCSEILKNVEILPPPIRTQPEGLNSLKMIRRVQAEEQMEEHLEFLEEESEFLEE